MIFLFFFSIIEKGSIKMLQSIIYPRRFYGYIYVIVSLINLILFNDKYTEREI